VRTYLEFCQSRIAWFVDQCAIEWKSALQEASPSDSLAQSK